MKFGYTAQMIKIDKWLKMISGVAHKSKICDNVFMIRVKFSQNLSV